jgi:uncharacterized phiE125 gp8 family phage protein
MKADRWSLTVTAPPALEPISLAEARDHLREDGTEQDVLIAGLIAAVRQHQEDTLGLALVSQTHALRLDSFPDEIELPRAPVQSVTSIAYVDTAGAAQTLSAVSYTVDIYSTPARIIPAYGLSWPDTRDVPNAVTVTYVAGYGATAAAVPDTLRSAALMRVADLYENRETQVVGATISPNPVADALEAPYRVWWL